LLKPVLGVRAGYLKASFQEMHERFGTIERYFTDGLGIDAGTLDRLREAFLTDKPDKGGQ
jgi:protein-tyrosine phosphatase